MKKIIQYSLLAFFLTIPLVTDAQTCTGEIRTDLTAAQACVDLAIAQGEALGYDMSCKVEQLPLGGFTDPTSGKDYILNGVCTVNGSTGHGAYLLAGFTASPGSTAVIQNVNPGWSILTTELAYEGAFSQCGGKAPYGSVVNGVSVYSCTPPYSGSVPASQPASTRLTDPSITNPLIRGSAILLNTIQSLYNQILTTYNNTYGIQLTGLFNNNPTGVASTGGSTTNRQCYVFAGTLTNGSSGAEVVALTYALKQEGFLTETTDFFDTNVMVAVKRFQEAHTTEILTILGLTQGTGVVGERTRAYLNSNCLAPASVASGIQTTTTGTGSQGGVTSCPLPTRSGIRNGKYQYTFSKNTNNTWTVTLNNPAYSTVSDQYYVQPNFAFIAPNAADLNRQNQGRFNYLSTLPGTAAGNTAYQDIFGSFNNAYYDWDNMTKDATTTCTSITTGLGGGVSTTSTQVASNLVRFIKVSVADWDTLPLALREITVFGPNNTIIKPVSISASDFNIMAYTIPTNLNDGNENTVWMATKNSGNDLQVITYDLGRAVPIEKVKVMNYGFTGTRVFVIEVSPTGNSQSYVQIAEIRAGVNTPIADKGIVWGMMAAASTVGPLQY